MGLITSMFGFDAEQENESDQSDGCEYHHWGEWMTASDYRGDQILRLEESVVGGYDLERRSRRSCKHAGCHVTDERWENVGQRVEAEDLVEFVRADE